MILISFSKSGQMPEIIFISFSKDYRTRQLKLKPAWKLLRHIVRVLATDMSAGDINQYKEAWFAASMIWGGVLHAPPENGTERFEVPPNSQHSFHDVVQKSKDMLRAVSVYE
eukprot:Protomagalhaensia_wolfi_Nauph_80__3214@NODE_3277_length_840_cov_5_757803_g2569_i0_p2_GENE_NODE_3277_length_840_cov_5_757803_g2569_i0NODE_3277_length_840_cov_5_757803_g2569_i0_p2_ORF_typecomplete_len112_score19_99_NODE_3277_length_840_cov_5_757803_g2569_i0474809